MCYFINGFLAPIILPKDYICLSIVIRVVKTYKYPQGFNIGQGSVSQGAH